MAKFDKTAYLFRTSFFKLFYKGFHRQSYRFIKRYIELHHRVLDIACGTGNFLNVLKKKKKGLEFFGIDQSEKMLEIGRKEFTGITLIQAEAEALPFRDRFFDFVTITDSFCYFQDEQKVLAEAARVLKPCGYLFLYTPSIDHGVTRIAMWAVKLFPTERDNKHLKIKDLTKLAESIGFKLVKKKIKPYPFASIYKCWLILFQKSKTWTNKDQQFEQK